MLKMTATVELDSQRPELLVEPGGNRRDPQSDPLSRAVRYRRGHAANPAGQRGHQLSGGRQDAAADVLPHCTAGTGSAWRSGGVDRRRRRADVHYRNAGRRRDPVAAAGWEPGPSLPSGTRRSTAGSVHHGNCATFRSTTEGTWRWPSVTGRMRKRRAFSKPWRKSERVFPAVDLLVGAVNVWCWDKDAARGDGAGDAGGGDRANPVEQPAERREPAGAERAGGVNQPV